MPVVGENFFPQNFCSVKTTHYFLPRTQDVGEIKFGEIFVPVQSTSLWRNFCRIQYYVCASEARELQPFANCNEDYTQDSLAVAWILSIGLDVCYRLGTT